MINYYFVSSPLHLLFGACVAQQYRGDSNIAVLVPRARDNVSRFEQVLASHKTIFDHAISFEQANLPGKTAERRRRCRELERQLRQTPADRIHTGTDRRVEFQYAMHTARQINPATEGIYIDEGMATYLGHKSIDSIAHRYIDPLIKKIVYGRWWHNPRTIGSSRWISRIYAAYPELAHDTLRHTEILPVPRALFATDAFQQLCETILHSAKGEDSALDRASLGRIRAMIVLTHESFYADYRQHLHGLVEALRAHYADAEIAIKAHPRSACLDEYRQRYPQLFHIDNTIGTEVFTPLLNDHCTIVGDISSTLFTARWLKPQARIAAVKLKALQGNALNDNLIKLFEQLQIPLVEQRDIAATLQP